MQTLLVVFVALLFILMLLGSFGGSIRTEPFYDSTPAIDPTDITASIPKSGEQLSDPLLDTEQNVAYTDYITYPQSDDVQNNMVGVPYSQEPYIEQPLCESHQEQETAHVITPPVVEYQSQQPTYFEEAGSKKMIQVEQGVDDGVPMPYCPGEYGAVL